VQSRLGLAGDSSHLSESGCGRIKCSNFAVIRRYHLFGAYGLAYKWNKNSGQASAPKVLSPCLASHTSRTGGSGQRAVEEAG
jgi:hypothetical protein